ncbi:hypothetical protein SALBM135S_04267 [Streptomyces alboniger]
MAGTRSLGRRFGWLWAAYAVSSFGTRLAFDAFSMIAILALGAGTTQVALISAVGLAVGAVAAVPLGPWVEFRRKRPVMIAMDLVRCAALLSVPAAYALGLLGLTHLLLVSAVVAAADITFTAASGAFLKGLVPPRDLLAANGRFESTTWTATMLGPPLGGAAAQATRSRAHRAGRRGQLSALRRRHQGDRRRGTAARARRRTVRGAGG